MEGYYPNEMMRPAFPFDKDILNHEFDPSVPPSTAQEYLQRVITEASTCDEVVTAQLDPSKICPQKSFELLPGLEQVEQSMIPSQDWQRCQASDFAAVRDLISRAKAGYSAEAALIPKGCDRKGWRKVCIGGEGDSNYQATAPLLSILINPCMTQKVLIKVLEYNVGWLAEGFSVQQGKWLYALLACLELPLYPETCCLLRELARECSRIRATLVSSEHEFLNHLNLLICLVSKYYRQLDLSD